MKNFVSIDWGGTNLRGVYVKDGFGKKFSMPAENIRIMSKQNIEANIKSVLSVELKDFANEKKTWLIGAAGAGDLKAVEQLKSVVRVVDSNCEAVEVWTDCEANHAACFGNGDGVLCVAGTGFMIYAKSKGNIVTGGGYGYLIDLLPSGAFFGQRALEGLLKSMDGFAEYEEYYKYAIELGFICDGDRKKQKVELLNDLYSSSNYQKFLAKYSVLFDLLLRRHETYAIKACLTAFENLGLVAEETIEKICKMENASVSEYPVKISGAGGVWDNMADFAELCCKAFDKCGCASELKKPMYELCFGPLALYGQTHKDVAEFVQQFKEK